MSTGELNMKTEEIQTTTAELVMETQTLEHHRKFNYNKIHVSLIMLLSAQVLFLLTFSEPMSFIWGGEPLFDIYNDDIIDRSARIIMIYHSIATPFIAATTFWCVSKSLLYPVLLSPEHSDSPLHIRVFDGYMKSSILGCFWSF